MELTVDRIYNEYKELVSGRKYWLVFLIMAPIFFIFTGAMGGIGFGIFAVAAFGIGLIIATLRTRSCLKKLKNGDFVIYRDVCTYKYSYRPYGKQQTRHIIRSMNLYKTNYHPIPYDYNKIEENQPFCAVYVGRKMITLYGLHNNVIGAELLSKVK